MTTKVEWKEEQNEEWNNVQSRHFFAQEPSRETVKDCLSRQPLAKEKSPKGQNKPKTQLKLWLSLCTVVVFPFSFFFGHGERTRNEMRVREKGREERKKKVKEHSEHDEDGEDGKEHWATLQLVSVIYWIKWILILSIPTLGSINGRSGLSQRFKYHLTKAPFLIDTLAHVRAGSYCWPQWGTLVSLSVFFVTSWNKQLEFFCVGWFIRCPIAGSDVRIVIWGEKERAKFPARVRRDECCVWGRSSVSLARRAKSRKNAGLSLALQPVPMDGPTLWASLNGPCSMRMADR